MAKKKPKEFIVEIFRVSGNSEIILQNCILEADHEEIVAKATGFKNIELASIREENRKQYELRWIALDVHLEQLRKHGSGIEQKLKKNFIFIPAPEVEGAHPFEEGYYSRNDVVKFMREHKNNPDVIEFLADMMEE